ncbi:MAG: endonuclease/exonuclease/phosphatase family protein, partial [Xanthomonadales bacterium]|nr:endonuclease/exonuclease/phosphatase family protein [Xanthomonadales bacterium]
MSDTLRIATWNIHGAVGLDRRRRPQRIVAVLDAIDADIIALQEVPLGDAMQQQLERDGRYHLIAAPTMTCRGEPFGNALLTRLPLIQSTLIDISVDRREPRVLIDARLRAANHSSLRILTTHCGLHADERRQQFAMLGALIADADNEASVILGDFNEARTSSRRWHALDTQHAPNSQAPIPAWLP